jgi:asparagine synthetase B (glutamine-hydrolysing)
MEQIKQPVPKEHHIREECGVFGVFSRATSDVASLAYYGLFALQHRGQESAGIAVNDDGVFTAYCDEGLVNEVFPKERIKQLGTGNIVVGHVRYATTGSDRKRNAQPIIINHHKGRMALAHNGNLTNSYELRNRLEQSGSIFHTTTDSEVIAYIIVQERLRTPSIEEAVYAAMGRIEGAYSLVISSPTKLIAARDPHGFRPLCMGETADGKTVFASESCALDAVGARFVRDIRPGEIVTVSEDEIAAAILALLEVQKTVAEGAGATPVAACMSGKVDTTKKTVCVVSGGNVDVTTLSRVITRGLTYGGRLATITTKLADRAGSLANLLNVVGGTGANVVRIHHEREDVNSEVNACVVSMVLETRNADHVQKIKDELTAKGYSLLDA